MSPILSIHHATSTNKGLNANPSKAVFRAFQAIRGATRTILLGRCKA